MQNKALSHDINMKVLQISNVMLIFRITRIDFLVCYYLSPVSCTIFSYKFYETVTR